MRLKSGDISPKTCTCNLCDARGKKIKTVAIKKGMPLPKTKSCGDFYDISE